MKFPQICKLFLNFSAISGLDENYGKSEPVANRGNFMVGKNLIAENAVPAEKKFKLDCQIKFETPDMR